MLQVRKPKLIFDPILGLIDVTEVIPLIDVQVFQALGFKYQLGLTATIYPAATHTRKQHSIGAYERTKQLSRNWVHHGFINDDEAKSLQAYALYHDIGHGPFSHVTETLGKVNHDERGLAILSSLKKVIESSGFDYNRIHDLFSRKDPLYLAVFDKNLGMEKLDYLERDAFYTLGERPGVEYLSKHVYYIDKKVVIDEIVVDQAKSIQDFYIKLSKNVYLRKKSAVLQRVVEKMTYYLMEDGLTETDLFNLTDFGLLGLLEVSENKLVKFLYGNFQKGIVPKITIDFKYTNVHTTTDVTQKPLKIIGLEDKVFERFMASQALNTVQGLNSLEKNL